MALAVIMNVNAAVMAAICFRGPTNAFKAA
jgi:hypothetical protein